MARVKIAVFPGDGIGPEVIAEAVKVLQALRDHGVDCEIDGLGAVHCEVR